jgi:hypothetical protein
MLAATVLAGAATPAAAKILKTKQASQYREFQLTIGSGFEYEGDSEEKQYDLPFLVEYGVTKALTVTVEPDYTFLDKAGAASIRGFGDLETSLVYEFVGERRSRPSLAAEVLVKWPTASSDSLTTGETDYSVGGIISKEFIHFDVDSEWLYTFVGDPPGVDLSNSSEISLAAAWHMTRRYRPGGGSRHLERRRVSRDGYEPEPPSVGHLAGRSTVRKYAGPIPTLRRALQARGGLRLPVGRFLAGGRRLGMELRGRRLAPAENH